MKKSKIVRDLELNEYFKRRCCNYEQFICDRTWECAFCARQSLKIEPLPDQASPTNNTVRKQEETRR